MDLRFNNGGWDRVPLILASHLTDSTLTAFTKQPVRHGSGLEIQPVEVSPAAGVRHTGPVAVLTSDATVSAAEVGTLALRALTPRGDGTRRTPSWRSGRDADSSRYAPRGQEEGD